MDLASLGQKISRRYSKSRRRDFRLSRMSEKLRIVSNIGLIVGQCILLFASRDAGLAVLICSSMLSVPFFLKAKMWDVLVLMAFMLCINVVGLFFQ